MINEVMIMEDVLLYYSLLYQGDFNKIYRAIVSKENADLKSLKEMKKALKCSYTTIISDDYPKLLKQITAPPFVLYYYGDLSLCQQNCFAMVGMREASLYGKKMANDISRYLAEKKIVVVSGMARGIDAYSHLGTMKYGGKTIAVLGSGIDYCYPKENQNLYQSLKKDHLILSEYPNDLKPEKEFFKRRNRIVTGLAEKLIVVEANKRSGTMISVGYALEQGKEVYCVPNRFNEHNGCNYLISQGANILVELEDLF